jgi:hypothetical protein
MEFRSYFSSSSNLRDIILNHLDGAEDSIFIAVAWFTDPGYFQKILQKMEEGVHVELLITKHQFNRDSPIDYNQINKLGGFFTELGDDFSLMHNKFCVIDYNHVLNGSFNWTKKANNSNSENLSLVSGDPITAEKFLEEFRTLKQLAGHVENNAQRIEFQESLKLLSIIKTFIDIGEPQKSFPYARKIKDSDKLKVVYDLIQLKEYEKVLVEIEKIQIENSQLLDISFIEKEFIKSQIKLLSAQLEALEIEKVEIENKIDAFNHRYVIELNPLIIKILAIKKKLNEKLKKRNIREEEFEDAERRYDEAVKEFEFEMGNELPELDELETKDIKELYRSSVKFCHPDSPQCIYQDKTEAAKIFSELTEAYKKNDLEHVRYLVEILKEGAFIDESIKFDKINYLRAKLETLKGKLFSVSFEIENLKKSDVYELILQYDDLSTYFKLKKKELENQLDHLQKKYVKNE